MNRWSLLRAEVLLQTITGAVGEGRGVSRFGALRRAAIEGGASAGVFRLLRRLRPRAISVLTYHGFMDDALRARGRLGYLFRYSVSIRDLESQLAFLQRSTHILDANEFLEILEGGAGPKHGVLVTIDDGLQSVLDLALPVFARYKVRPILLVPTAGVTRASAGLPWIQWHERLASLVLTDAVAIERGWPALRELLTGLPIKPSHAALSILQDLTHAAWRCSGEARQNVLRTMRELVGNEPNPEDLQYSAGPGSAFDLMTWDQLSAIPETNVEVGSHTVSHTRLSSLSKPELEREIETSACEIRERLRKPCRFFAAPYGHPADLHPQQEPILAAAGYRAAFTQEDGPFTLPVRSLRVPRTCIRDGYTIGQLDYFLGRVRLAHG